MEHVLLNVHSTSLFWQSDLSLQDTEEELCFGDSKRARPAGGAAASAAYRDKLLFTQMHTQTCLWNYQSHSGKMDGAGVWRRSGTFQKAVKHAGWHGRAQILHLTTCVQRKGLLLAKQHTCPVNTASILAPQLLSCSWLHPSHLSSISVNSPFTRVALHSRATFS